MSRPPAQVDQGIRFTRNHPISYRAKVGSAPARLFPGGWEGDKKKNIIGDAGHLLTYLGAPPVISLHCLVRAAPAHGKDSPPLGSTPARRGPSSAPALEPCSWGNGGEFLHQTNQKALRQTSPDPPHAGPPNDARWPGTNHSSPGREKMKV